MNLSPASLRPVSGHLGYLFLLVALAACGGGSSSDSDSTSDGGSNTAAVAVAGGTVDVARNASFSLTGSGSSDADGDSLTYTWTQTMGVDVTGGAGFVSGETPLVTAPADVSTLMFSLVVNDGQTDSAPDTVQINVMEQPAEAIFIDGDAGSDTTGVGSRTNPYATISHALTQLPGPGYDLYVRSRSAGAYTENGAASFSSPGIVSIEVPTGSSLYGGFGPDWVRDVVANRTALQTRARGIHFTSVNQDTWFSGFNLDSFNPASWATPESAGISADSGTATLYIQDNQINSGDANATSASSYGLRLAGLGGARILRNDISAGDGGNGEAGVDGLDGNNGGNGSSTSSRDGGTRGSSSSCAWGSIPGGNCDSYLGPATRNGSGSMSINGGGGGRGGGGLGGNGDSGFRGFRDGDIFHTATGSSGGSGGSGGDPTNIGGDGSGGFPGNTMSRGGAGGNGRGSISGGVFVNNSARDGQRGGHGGGGGGGGGGEGGTTTTGGGGGGGGSGGVGGQGGTAGSSGGASIGILVTGIADVLIEGNTILSGNGGNGAAGGDGGEGGNGGNGGSGRGQDGGGEAGGDGGGGGHGGQGGEGGAGGGGPSYGILVGANMAPVINQNQLTGGNGGAPGADGAGTNGGANGGRWGNPGSTGGSGATGYQANSGSDGSPAEGGWTYSIYDLDPGDGLVPSVSGNTTNVGTAGSRGQAGAQNF